MTVTKIKLKKNNNLKFIINLFLNILLNHNLKQKKATQTIK